MRLVVCVNHSYPHIGGSEKVVQQISESMHRRGEDVAVVSRSLRDNFEHNGVKYKKCASDPKQFVAQLKKLRPDHTHVYSDCFSLWPTLLKESEQVPGTKSIALVGMNHMSGARGDFKRFVQKKEQFSVITHSDNYQDYTICDAEGICPTVIPNGVDLEEFDNSLIGKFRNSPRGLGGDKRKLILCVSNFFPGKGQEHLNPILSRLAERRQDWIFSLLSCKANFALAGMMAKKVKGSLMACRKYDAKFIEDLPREMTVSAFMDANVFLFTSQKEVAPLVVLEAQAARVPWVSLPVGNTTQLKGGFMVPPSGKNGLGFMTYNNATYDMFADRLDSLLGDEALWSEMSSKGRQEVEEIYNWDKIADRYHEVFSL